MRFTVLIFCSFFICVFNLSEANNGSVLAASALPTPRLPASLQTDDAKTVTLDRIYKSSDFRADFFGGTRWLDGKSYSIIETSSSIPGFKDIVKYDAETGERNILISAEQVIPEGNKTPLTIENVQWSPDGTKALIYTNSKRVWRRNTQGDYWVLSLDSGYLQQIGAGFPASSLMFAKFSPDSSRVAYVQKIGTKIHDIYMEDIATGERKKLTHDGSETVINGTFDWAYEEEFGLRDGFQWAPDGQSIAFWQIDASGVKDYTLMNYTKGLYPTAQSFSYPKVGETISAAKIGVVSTTTGKTVWMKVPYDARAHYIPYMAWAGNSSEVLVQQLNRRQNTNRVYLASAATGRTVEIMKEEDSAWLDPVTDLVWLDGADDFLWVSEAEGWRQIYRVSRSGQKRVKITPGAYDVISIVEIDVEGGFVYFLASPDDPQRQYLYRSSLDGGKAERLSSQEQTGWHSYSVSPTGKYAFNTWSRRDLPPQKELVRLPDHTLVRRFVDNNVLKTKIDQLDLGKSEFFSVTMDDGVTLEGFMRFPPRFDPNLKYPVLFYVYGEPAGMTAADRWDGSRGVWHRMMTQKGYIFVTLDNRGQPAPKGRTWRKSIYRKVGLINVDDQAEAARKLLAARPYMDAERVGIWGHSGGGTSTLHALFRHGDVFKVGVSRAPVADIRLYDAIYQERYSGLLPEDMVYYRDAAALKYADQLTGKLLLIHGSGDDNVHYQNSEYLINQLVSAGKQFSFMNYPNRTHGIFEGKGTTYHLMDLQTRYFLTHMPPNASAEP